jgi:hypothetical protein
MPYFKVYAIIDHEFLVFLFLFLSLIQNWWQSSFHTLIKGACSGCINGWCVDQGCSCFPDWSGEGCGGIISFTLFFWLWYITPFLYLYYFLLKWILQQWKLIGVLNVLQIAILL